MEYIVNGIEEEHGNYSVTKEKLKTRSLNIQSFIKARSSHFKSSKLTGAQILSIQIKSVRNVRG